MSNLFWMKFDLKDITAMFATYVAFIAIMYLGVFCFQYFDLQFFFINE